MGGKCLVRPVGNKLYTPVREARQWLRENGMYRVTYSDFIPARSASEWMLRDDSLAFFEVSQFSREAVTAHSRGRQPTEQDENEHVSREAAAAEMIAVAASRL